MNLHLVDGRGGQVAFHARPLAAAVPRHPQAGLGADVEQVGVLRVFENRAHHLALRQVAHDGGRGDAEIGRGEDVGRVVAAAVPVKRDVGGAIGVLRGHDVRHVGPFRDARELVRDVDPLGTAIARDADDAVVGARPDDAGAAGRLLECHNRAPRGDAVVLGDLRGRVVHVHDRQRLALGIGGEIGADRRVRAPAVARLHQHLRADVDGGGIVRRELHGGVPVEAVRRGLTLFRLERLGPHRGALVGRAVDAAHAAVLRLAVDDARIGRIHQRLEAIAAIDHIPVVVGDARVGAHGARSAPGVVVLQPGAEVIRRAHVEGQVIGLGKHQVGQPLPGGGAIARDAHAAVVADDEVLRVARVDPQRVVIDVDALGAVGAERLAGVIRHVQRHAQHVDARVGLRVDADLAEVHRPRVDVAHLAPGGAGVVGAIHAALSGVFDARVEHVGIGAVDVHPDAALGTGGDAALDLRPRLAGVRRLPHAAAGTASVHAPRRAPPLVGGGVEHLVVAGIHDQLGGAGVVIDVQRALPGESAVGGLVDAAFATRGP